MNNTDATPTDADPTPPRQRRRMGCQLVLLLLITVLALGGLWAYWKWNSVPAYWTATHLEMGRYSKQEIATLAQSLQARVLNELSRITPAPAPGIDAHANTTSPDPTTGSSAAATPREGDVRAIAMTSVEINAWLRAELPNWLAFRGASIPQGVGDITFATEGDHLVLGMRMTTAEIDQVVSILARVKTDPVKGAASIQNVSMRGGELPVPADLVNRHLGKDLASKYAAELQQLQQALAGAAFDAIFPIDEKRQGRLVGLDVRPGGITAQVRVERTRK